MQLQKNRTTMEQMFKLTDARDQTEHGFDQHPLAPGFVGAKLEIARRFIRLLEAKIAQDNRLLVKLMGDWTKGLVMDVGCVPVPGDDFAPVIDQPAQLNPDDPTPIRLAFLAQRLLTTPLAHGVNQFNPIGVDDGEEGWLGQETFAPVLMRPQGTRNAGAVGQFDEQILKVTLQPAVERPKEAAFEGIQQFYRHHFTRIEVGIRAFL